MTAEVIVVGSLNMDLVSRVGHLPAPGQTVIASNLQTFIGGKGLNQALACARAGANVTMVGRIGNDAYGRLILDKLKSERIDTENICQDRNAGTGCAFVCVDERGENQIVVAPEANSRLSAADIKQASSHFTSAKILLLQLEIPTEAVLHALKLAQESSICAVLNPAPVTRPLPEAILKLVDVIVPNQTEAEILTGIGTSDEHGAHLAAQALGALGPKTVIITLGAKGVVYLNGDGKVKTMPAFAVKAVDTTGAGDAFCGAFAAAQAAGRTLEDSIKFASAAGALSATISGAEPSLPVLSDIDNLLRTARTINP